MPLPRAPFFAKDQPYEIDGWPKVWLDYRATREYTFLQLYEIAEGLRRNLNVGVYANPSFNHHQMYVLRLGLQNRLEVDDVARADISWMDMLRTLEKRGHGLSYYPGMPKEKKLLMPSIEEMELMLLWEPAAPEKAQEPEMDLQEIYDSMPDGMRVYIDSLLGKKQEIDSDVVEARGTMAGRAPAHSVCAPEVA